MKRSCGMLILMVLVGFRGYTDDPPEMRALYVPTFSTNTQSACDAVISNVLSRNLNAVFVQVRSRGDAYYYPNREDSTYPNPEPRSQLYTISPADLDVLQYYIDRLHNANPKVEVHAWLTTYNTWNRTAAPASPNHVLNAHPEWVTETLAGVTITDEHPLDPGIPAVQDYLYNIFMDVVRNYDIDGIQFDYIRLFSADSGYDPVAKAQFLAETGWNYDTENQGGRLDGVYKAWRRDQISQLVQRVHSQTMLEKPWVEVSAFLINFTDSVENRGQGYNWWVAHNAIDVLHPGCYSSTVSGTVGDWNFYVQKLAQNGDQNKRPMVAAIGSYLFLDAERPGDNLVAVNTLRGNSRIPEGYNFFAYAALFQSGTPADQLSDDLFNPGGPMDGWAPVPPIPHKTQEETLSPNLPASLSIVLQEGVPRVSFSRPASASDGDLPVHYRLYRDTQTPVRRYYENMVMEWWDPNSSRTSFSYDDGTAPSSNLYYAAIAYDDWNNEAVAFAGPFAYSGGGEIIIESHTPAGTLTPVSQGYSQSGSWYGLGSDAKSSASGLTGSRTEFSSNSSLDAFFTITPNIPQAGVYDIYITTPSASSVNAANSTYRIVHSGGVKTGIIALTNANTGNKWALLASSIPFAQGTGGSVTVSEGSPQGDRFYSDAVRFVRVSSSVSQKESKPAVIQSISNVTEAIVDNAPRSLDYDDEGSWSTTSYLGGYWGADCRYYRPSSAFLDGFAVWVVDLPQSGYWAIDGWIRENQNLLAEGARYRFVDGEGVIHNVVATQQPGSGGWNINVDGVPDDSACFFNQGRVYVTLYGNAVGDGQLMADGLRFRRVRGEESGDSMLQYY